MSWFTNVRDTVENVASTAANVASTVTGGVLGNLGGAAGAFGAVAGLSGLLGGSGPLPQQGGQGYGGQANSQPTQQNLEGLSNLIGRQVPTIAPSVSPASIGGGGLI